MYTGESSARNLIWKRKSAAKARTAFAGASPGAKAQLFRFDYFLGTKACRRIKFWNGKFQVPKSVVEGERERGRNESPRTSVCDLGVNEGWKTISVTLSDSVVDFWLAIENIYLLLFRVCRPHVCASPFIVRAGILVAQSGFDDQVRSCQDAKPKEFHSPGGDW